MTSALHSSYSASRDAVHRVQVALSRLAANHPRTTLYAAVSCAYALLACLVFWPVAPLDDAHTVTCGCYDVVAQTWYMTWVPHAILSGTNPLFTHAMNVPYGVNLAVNTEMPLLGIAIAPIKWIFGPFASFNVLIRLAYLLSALSMFYVLRRFVRTGVAILGGAIYGFSPYVFAQASLHLNLSFIPVPPLLVLSLYEIVVRRRWSTRRAGLTLGALVVAQYFISPEILTDFVLVSAIVFVLLVIRYPRQTIEHLRYFAWSLAWALLPVVVLCAYPAAFALAGAQHMNFTPGVIYGDSTFRADLLSPLVPTSGQLLGTSHLKSIADSWVGANTNENDVYLGLPAVVLFFAFTAFVRNAMAKVMALGAIVAFVFALGPGLVVDGHGTTITLPFAILQHLPVLKIEVPARYACLTDLGVAFVLAVGIDRAIDGLSVVVRNWKSSRPKDNRAWLVASSSVAVVLVSIAMVLSLLPSGPIKTVPTRVPTYFTTSAVDEIPSGSNALAYPYPIIQANFAMAWQVEAGFRFNLIGDYAYTPFQKAGPAGGGPGGGLVPPTLTPTFVENFFESAYEGPPLAVPSPSPAAFSTVHMFLERYKIDTILVDRVGAEPGKVTTFFTQMFQSPPHQYGSLSVWYHVRNYKLPQATVKHHPKRHRKRHTKKT